MDIIVLFPILMKHFMVNFKQKCGGYSLVVNHCLDYKEVYPYSSRFNKILT